MQNDRNHLTMNSEEIKGNNPYLLNRMTVDSSFRTPQCNINAIVGYGADGNVISTTDTYNPFSTKATNSGFNNIKKPSTELGVAQHMSWSFIDKPDRQLKADLAELRALTSSDTKKQKIKTISTIPDWRLAFNSSSVLNGETSLQKLTQDRYNAILYNQ